MIARWLFLCVSGVACSTPTSTSTSKPPQPTVVADESQPAVAPKPEPLSCAEWAARMDTRSRGLTGVMSMAPEHIEPLVAPSGRAAEVPRLEVALARDGAVEVQGRRLRASELPREIARIRQERGEAGRPLTALYLWVDAKTPVPTFREFLADLPKDLEPRLMVFGPEPRLHPDDKVLIANPDVANFIQVSADYGMPEVMTYSAKSLAEAIGQQCPNMMRLFGSVANVSPDRKAKYIAEGVSPALLSCDCALPKQDLFEYVIYKFLGAYEPASLWLRPPADKAGAVIVSDLVPNRVPNLVPNLVPNRVRP